MEHFGVIDLGSNSARLTVTEISDDGTTKKIIEEKEPVRLSENMGPEKELKQPAMERTLTTLENFRKLYKDLPKLNLRAVATAATRMAANQKEFLKLVKKEADIDLEVITGAMEAHYDYLGVINSLPVVNAVLMDTGGASTELILVQNRRAVNLISLPLGSVNLSERYLEKDLVSASSLFQLFTAMENLYNDIWWLDRGKNLPIVALGGSNRTLAKIQRRRDNFKRYWDIHGFRMSGAQVNDIFDEVVSKDLAARKDIPGLSKERGDIIIGGLSPAVLLQRHLDSDRMIFSQQGLRDGILYEHLSDLENQGKFS
ncbi:exopolyphosphatase [Agrilactobacillus fermenti]|uniref:Ppx/GppA family phosphatase n=1 Tax=Agrilactobacillus fermenti TaxID=2586909 RepID=UPI001E343D1D|nr:Ppx/GppA family phosphatase [Agrilactobacillus fermenti]MCD2255998.1 Ppx/GppA family phosphatase [Agrilactobacillus fermenti]